MADPPRNAAVASRQNRLPETAITPVASTACQIGEIQASPSPVIIGSMPITIGSVRAAGNHEPDQCLTLVGAALRRLGLIGLAVGGEIIAPEHRAKPGAPDGVRQGRGIKAIALDVRALQRQIDTRAGNARLARQAPSRCARNSWHRSCR